MRFRFEGVDASYKKPLDAGGDDKKKMMQEILM